MTVYDHLEVSVFPGQDYAIVLQLDRDVADFMASYFFTDSDSDERAGGMSERMCVRAPAPRVPPLRTRVVRG